MSITPLRKRKSAWQDFLDRQESPSYLDVHNGLLLPGPGKPRTQRITLDPVVLQEFTYGLQQMPDASREQFEELWRDFAGMTTLTQGQPRQSPGRKRRTWKLQGHVLRAWWDITGADPLLEDIWPVMAYDLTAFHNSTIDWTPVTVDWLREGTKEWVRDARPSLGEVRQLLRCLTQANTPLALIERTPNKLRGNDATAVWRHLNGLQFSAVQRAAWVGMFFRHIQELKAFGVPIHHTFVRRSIHTVAAEEPEPGRRHLQDETIRVLDANLDALATAAPDRKYPAGVAAATRRGIYLLARDTGRRISEVVALRRDCLEGSVGNWSLRYDNFKAGRMGRLLPIHSDTAAVIQQQQAVLTEYAIDTEWLFPSAGFGRQAWYSTNTATSALSEWVAGLDLPADEKERCTWHAFRHTYAQRHADAGTHPDVLRRLMDHENLATTSVYYEVNDERRRKAVEGMNAFVVDRKGKLAPFEDEERAMLSSVAVAWGRCTEPSNVKAGGQSCPIRNQCSGCGHFRTEPSYIPQIKDQVARLTLDRERAEVMGVEAWTIAGIDKEIAAYKKLLRSLEASVRAVPAEQRASFDDNLAVLRRDHARSLPLHVL